ncbi:MAG: hypothetical protein ACI8X5_004084 [Planctomycetota bacterium]|jgi:hypothetical protein
MDVGMRTSAEDVRTANLGREPQTGQIGRLWAALAIALIAACVSPEMRDDTTSGTLAASQGTPNWVGMPLGWDKLEQIDRWLERDAGGYEAYWQIQGELTLAEGRLTFAKRDQASATAQSRTWLARLQGARAGFQHVLASSSANRLQVARARTALSEIDGMHGPVAAPASTGRYLARHTWNAKRPIPSRLDPTTGGYNRITIHHTADLQGVRFDGSLGDSIKALQLTQHLHMDTRDFGDIGYHFLIDASGRIFEGRDLKYQGAHAGGANNVSNIGVCMVGSFEHKGPSSPAMATLNGLLAELRLDHGIARTRIVGHRELKSTACPGESLARWTKEYRRSGPSLSQLHTSPRGSRPAVVAQTPVSYRTSGAREASSKSPRRVASTVVR